MENITQEQFLAFGMVGFAIFGVALLLMFLLMAGTLKLSISWMGNRTPTFLACLGWLFAISFVNCFLVIGTLTVFGEGATLLVTPLTWFVTLYMVSVAADCGLIRAFGIWIVNSILSTIGLVAILMMLSIPLAMIGAGVNATGDDLQAKFDAIEEQLAESEDDLQELDSVEFPTITEVNFEREGEEPTEAPDELNRRRPTDEFFFTPESGDPPPPPRERVTPEPKASKKSSEAPKSRKARRAADGSTLNPFFQN